jgi:hypothetical protein
MFYVNWLHVHSPNHTVEHSCHCPDCGVMVDVRGMNISKTARLMRHAPAAGWFSQVVDPGNSSATAGANLAKSQLPQYMQTAVTSMVNYFSLGPLPSSSAYIVGTTWHIADRAGCCWYHLAIRMMDRDCSEALNCFTAHTICAICRTRLPRAGGDDCVR